jgi:hypothetical protein
MRERWLPVGALAVGLFAINVVGRLVARFAYSGDNDAANVIILVMLISVGLVFLVAAAVRSKRQPVERWTTDLAAAAFVGLLLTIFVGPFISGANPFSYGAGEFFLQIWQWAGVALLGAGLGYMIVTALGQDYRSQSLKRFAEAKLAKPRRVVRR